MDINLPLTGPIPPEPMGRKAVEPRRAGPILNRVEWICAILLLLAVLWPAGLLLGKMATTSLWGDEIYSIKFFTSKGPWHVITDYSKPNNHIFFNLLGSLTPGRTSFEPLRARLWSFIAFGGLLVWLGWFFAQRRQFLEGALVLALLCLNKNTLDLIFQARGYGILHLCAAGLVFTGIRYLETRRLVHLVIMGLLVVAGTWSVPHFILFGGVLMGLLWLQCRNRAVFLTGALTLLAVLLVYLPVLRQMATVGANYSKLWGASFKAETILKSVGTYLIVGSNTTALWVLVAASLAPFLYFPKKSPTAQILRWSVLAAAIFFLACWVLRTPPVRTTAFVSVVYGLSLVASAGALFRRIDLPPLRLALMLTLTGALIFLGVRQARRFTFVPLDAWREVAATIRQIAPPHTPVHVIGEAYLLRAYLPESEYPAQKKLDLTLFAQSKLIVVDAPTARKPSRFKDTHPVLPHGLDIVIPSRRYSGFESVSYVSKNQ